MKNLKRIVLLLLLLASAAALASCSTVHPKYGRISIGRDIAAEQFEVTYHPDGTPASLSYVAIDSNESKAFRDAALAGTTMVVSNIQAGVEKAKSADSRDVAITGLQEDGQTGRAAIGASERIATSVGNNPEANVPALESTRRFFRPR